MVDTLRRLARLLFAPVRLLLLLWLVLGGLVVVAAVFPRLAQATANAIIRRWSRALLAVVGVELSVSGAPAAWSHGVTPGTPGRLLLANHISWLDVFAMNAAVPTRFVAKSDILGWPLIGALVRLAGTLFIERGRRHAVHAMNQMLVRHLSAGETIGVFAEGTTGDGTSLLTFHSNLVPPALTAGAAIVPVALQYTQSGRRSAAAVYIGDTTLWQSLWMIITAPGLTVELQFLPALADLGEARRQVVARSARAAIAAALDLPLQPHASGQRDLGLHQVSPDQA